ncbi:MAG TPA: hypothetical protein VMZ30_14875 [Pyrinomonadaceae bacterium]|nr:hypothetical protein [Pyrinomonadaceae bacterium]
MHNCKTSKSNFVELACNEIPPARSRQLLSELNDCVACREEYEAVRSTVHVSGQALRSGLPAETFWPTYRERLRYRLVSSQSQNTKNGADHSSAYSSPMPLSSRVWEPLRRMASSSVRVPVPAALVLILMLGAVFVVLHSRAQVNAAGSITPSVSVETRTVQVPVIQEKVITRVVYVDKSRRRGAAQPDRTAVSATANSVARAFPNTSQTPLSLIDFKPTDQVKLTVIKGNYKDEK